MKIEKPGKLDHHDKEGNLISSEERDMYNQALTDMDTYQKGQMPTVGEILKKVVSWIKKMPTHPVMGDKGRVMYFFIKDGDVKKISQAIYDLYEERMGGKRAEIKEGKD